MPDDRRTARPAGGSSRRCRCRSTSGAWKAATAAAEPPLLPPGHAVERPRVGRRAVRRVLGRRAHRELVHVGLAEDDRAGVAQPLGDVGVVRRAVALEDPRAGRALAALDRDEVLERDRDAEQRMERRRAPRRPRRAPPPAGRRRASASASARSRSMVSQALRPSVLALGQVEVGVGQLARRDVAARAAGRPSRGRGARVSVGAIGRALSARRGSAGTTMKSPSRAGALARTASTGSDGRATSSRRMFSSSIVWAVGAMSSVGTARRGSRTGRGCG